MIPSARVARMMNRASEFGIANDGSFNVNIKQIIARKDNIIKRYAIFLDNERLWT